MIILAYLGLGLAALLASGIAAIAAGLVLPETEKWDANWNMIWIMSVAGIAAQALAICCAFLAGVLS